MKLVENIKVKGMKERIPRLIYLKANASIMRISHGEYRITVPNNRGAATVIKLTKPQLRSLTIGGCYCFRDVPNLFHHRNSTNMRQTRLNRELRYIGIILTLAAIILLLGLCHV